MVPKLITLTELLAKSDVPVKYIVERFLARGGLSALFADPKAGKSTFARNLLAHVVTGQSFLGRNCSQTSALYYALEEPEGHVAAEFRRMGQTADNLHLRIGPIPKEDISDVLQGDIARLGIGLVVIDPLFDMIEAADANAYAQMNALMKSVLAIARNTDCHIMVLHHTNKGQHTGGRSALGSQAIAGATDHNAFLVRRQDGTRVFSSEARVGAAFDPVQLGYDSDTNALWGERDEREAKIGHMMGRLYDALGMDTLTTSEWRSRVTGRNSEKVIAIHQLKKQGEVIELHEGRINRWQRRTV